MNKINKKHLIRSFVLSLLLLVLSVGIFSALSPTLGAITHQFTQRDNVDGKGPPSDQINFICQQRWSNENEYSFCSFGTFVHDFFENIYLWFLISGFLTIFCLLTVPYIIFLTSSLYKKTENMDIRENKNIFKEWFKKFILITVVIYFLFYLFIDFEPLKYVFFETH